MFFSWRIDNPNLSTFTKTQRNQINSFQTFVNEKPNGFCSICMKLLYPEQQKFRSIPNDSDIHCTKWKLMPICMEDDPDLKMVCINHWKSDLARFKPFEYPGDLIEETANLNYREKSVLSPVRLMSQITRKSTLLHGRIGHFEVKGTMYNVHNYEFAEMAYGGTLSLFFQRGDPASINKKNVKAAYRKLQSMHPLLARYELPKLTYSLVNYHVSENNKYVGIRNGWMNNTLFAKDDINPQATDIEFKDLIIGQDNVGKYVRYSHPSLLALVFPYLYTNCKGHYSMVPTNTEEFELRTGIYGIPEEHGGASKATLNGETLGYYAKTRLLLRDRRFARDPSFLFFMLDLIEKRNIAAANRFVVPTLGRPNLRQSDIVNERGKMNKNLVSTVTPQIRSSYSYKRRNFLDLQCIFDNLGAPQLFLTFTCDDKSEQFKGLSDPDVKFPWEDPVAFTLHFKRKWQKFFTTYICQHFANQIGGIKEFSWVMEIQDRGSPHIHLVLWTVKSLQELIDMNVVHTWFPEGSYTRDPIMHRLVESLQVHHCNDNYCKKGDVTRKCRFGYPKPFSPETVIEADDSVIYKRSVGDAWVNNYNPYLLAVFRTSMDIQYNNGPQAVRYLAKYLAKDDYEAKIMLKNIQQRNSGYYKRTTYVTEKEHYATRIVGAVEATYDVLGWHKHSNSRNVLFLNTSLFGQDTRRIRTDIHEIDEESEDIFAKSHVEIYEKRDGAAALTMPEFFCYYKRDYTKTPSSIEDVTYAQRPYYHLPLPNYVISDNSDVYRLINDKPSFWRTFNQSEKNDESFYYQQIITKKAIFNSTFEHEKHVFVTWKDYYEYLLDLEEGGIINERTYRIDNINDISDAVRGIDACKEELKIMYSTANKDQKSIFSQIISEIHFNSVAFVSGAAGTGKSFLLRMLERHFKVKGYKVFKLAPTGVAAYNVSGQTIHRFFGMTNVASVPNFTILDQYVKQYPRILLLIDEYSMISSKMLEAMHEALVKTTQKPVNMGGIKTIFFGDIAQLLPILKEEGKIWENDIFNTVNKYYLNSHVRQTDAAFVSILNKVRCYEFDKEVIQFINKHTVRKSELPLFCLRLYTTRERVRVANEKDYKEFPGEGQAYKAYDSYVGNERSAKASLRETRLLENLYLKVNMPVMLIQNINVQHGWVNGTIAVIECLEAENICIRKNTRSDESEQIYWIQRISRQVPGTSYVRSQYPLIPAFASTIHKSQSATIDCVGIHLDNMMTHGQLYVAMSRVRSSDNLYFFGAELPLKIKRKFGVDIDAVEIIRKRSRI